MLGLEAVTTGGKTVSGASLAIRISSAIVYIAVASWWLSRLSSEVEQGRKAQQESNARIEEYIKKTDLRLEALLGLYHDVDKRVDRMESIPTRRDSSGSRPPK